MMEAGGGWDGEERPVRGEAGGGTAGAAPGPRPAPSPRRPLRGILQPKCPGGGGGGRGPAGAFPGGEGRADCAGDGGRASSLALRSNTKTGVFSCPERLASLSPLHPRHGERRPRH